MNFTGAALAAFTLALASGTIALFSPISLAREQRADSGTDTTRITTRIADRASDKKAEKGANADSSGKEGAKNLFYRQMEQPKASINTGLQYWIELKRDGKVSNVSNKFSFKSGDKIRIHVKSNVDGYAYIALMEGSRGEQSILFPDPQFHDNNTVKASTDYPIPGDGYLTFDQNPGTEKLVLMLSRKQMDARQYIADNTKKRVQIAAVGNGSKDLIPGSVVLAYAEQDNNVQELKATPNGSNSSGTPSTPQDGKKKSDDIIANNDSAVTTLIQRNPEDVLAVDVALMHRP